MNLFSGSRYTRYARRQQRLAEGGPRQSCTFTYAITYAENDRNTVQGEFVDGLREGQGVLYYINGST